MPDWPKYVSWVAAGVLLLALSCVERQKGRADEQIAQLAAQHRADSLVADSVGREAHRMAQEAAKARSEAQTAVRQSEAARTQTRASNAQAASTRRDAERILADSTASLRSTQQVLVEVLRTARLDSAVNARRMSQDSLTIDRLRFALHQDSTAIAKGIEATNAALRRAVSAEKEVSLLQHRGGGWRGMAVAAGITFAACKTLVRCQ